MLTFNLKKEWYEKIRSGEKRIEYREVKPYWTKRIENLFGEWSARPTPQLMARLNQGQGIKFSICPCMLQLGYTGQKMFADISKIEVVDGKETDLHVDKPVYAIHFSIIFP